MSSCRSKKWPLTTKLFVQDQLDLMFSQLVACTSLSELAILMPLVNTASAEENYLTDGLSKIAPEKLVRGLAGIRSIKLRQAFNFHFLKDNK